jgi:AraC-like DNA-binding protein
MPRHSAEKASMVANCASIIDGMCATPVSARAETPIAFIQCMVMAYEQRGLNPINALIKAQIAPELLNQTNARVTALQMEWMSEAAMRELDDEALGWFNRRLPWGSYGMLARASLGASTLRLAVQRWCRHHMLLTDDIDLRLVQDGPQAWIELQEHPERRDLGVFREFCTVSLLRNALGVACWLTDSRIPLQSTELHFAAPAHADSYRVLFDGPVSFDATNQHFVSRIGFDAGYLDLPVRRDEAALQRMLQRALLLTVRPYRRDRRLVERARQTLAAHPLLGRNAEELARHLGLSVRSLHRQLKEEGASLQSIKDGVRRETAIQLLLKTRKPIKQIAAEVGFSSEKSFMRAFRIWTGTTAEALRKN